MFRERLSDLPNDSRVWIYQADRFLSKDEEDLISSELSSFMKNWRSHGEELETSFEIAYSKFIVIAVRNPMDNMGGCSIDSSVAVLKSLSDKLGVDFLNRQLVVWKEGSEIKQSPMHEFWALRKAGRITDDTIVFNNLVKTIDEYNLSWEGPFSASWHAEMW